MNKGNVVNPSTSYLKYIKGESFQTPYVQTDVQISNVPQPRGLVHEPTDNVQLSETTSFDIGNLLAVEQSGYCCMMKKPRCATARTL